ncbi:adenine phosphoribosyltransferase [Luteipulveratus mongoliensis]|uniref:Adenine phosphoribosyltransferase n=1 Tax=Luteipulveratus mongoliensis TaxID=571913 RepID=A0A0K1JJY7_9MICO|nr:adenine phosphoribosyltransferase [Luteipulveratus mongoliensis]AKU16898.1 adenine phosphoribosyltransferase [Luteipulveratus mongoliensis]
MSGDTAAELLLQHTRDVADFPKPGILFKDLTPLFMAPAAFEAVVQDIADRYRGKVDVVAGVEARGFIVGSPVALALGVAFVPVRKAGKLPGQVVSQEYDLEYGTATIEVHADAFAEYPRVLVLDDVLATGGTAAAACTLVERAGGGVTAVEMLLELGALEGRKLLSAYELHVIASV